MIKNVVGKILKIDISFSSFIIVAHYFQNKTQQRVHKTAQRKNTVRDEYEVL